MVILGASWMIEAGGGMERPRIEIGKIWRRVGKMR